MNPLTIAAFFAALVVLPVLALCARFGKRFTHGLAVNSIADKTHPPRVTRRADAAQTTRYLLVKSGSDAGHIAVTAAVTDRPIGVCLDEPAAAEDTAAVALLGLYPETLPMTANAAIAANALLTVGAAGGKVATLPGTSGSYWIVGQALNAAAADGDLVEVQHCFPILRVVP